MTSPAELRAAILSTVSRTGGHLASSLGAVELACALAAVFEPTRDRVLWDVGHQAYAWKLLTGRADRFGTLRTLDGIGPFVNPEESAADAFVAGHAGNALAAALGMAAARDARGGSESVVAVVGDASLANGGSLEALTVWSAVPRRVILVVNDNASVKAPWLCRRFFESFGLAYSGPVGGHDVPALAAALTAARAAPRGAVVHVVTQKGRGFAPAEADPVRWHGTDAFDPAHPEADAAVTGRTWSDCLGVSLAAAARRDPRVCAVVAAMRQGTGLDAFGAEFPGRLHDVGICEATAVTFAAGLAKAGMRPVVAVYSTFLQRVVDQIMHDVCILNLPVVFAVDRAGCVGPDGRTHHGMFDVAMLRALPNLTIVQPSDAADFDAVLTDALGVSAPAARHAGPVAIRYPRGVAPAGGRDTPCAGRGKARTLGGETAAVQIWALGDQVPKARAVADLLARDGIAAGVVDARFVKPFDAELLARQRAAGARIVSIENGARAGGFGEAIGADARFGWPDTFVGHGTVAELERRHGLTAGQIADALRRSLGKGVC